MKIFGYASLISADAINQHKLGEKFTESDLQEAKLKGYSRSWNAVDGHWRYLGLKKDSAKWTNGVIFNLENRELPRFKQVEGVPEVYDFVDVSEDILPKQSEPVFTLVTREPSYKGVIPADYVQQVKAAIKHRSQAFQFAFKAQTDL